MCFTLWCVCTWRNVLLYTLLRLLTPVTQPHTMQHHTGYTHTYTNEPSATHISSADTLKYRPEIFTLWCSRIISCWCHPLPAGGGRVHSSGWDWPALTPRRWNCQLSWRTEWISLWVKSKRWYWLLIFLICDWLTAQGTSYCNMCSSSRGMWRRNELPGHWGMTAWQPLMRRSTVGHLSSCDKRHTCRVWFKNEILGKMFIFLQKSLFLP